MPTVAEQLRAAREARKLDIYQVAEATKIRTDHIRALEAGDYDPFVAPVYIRGFVRTYATLLKLDLPQVMATLDAELRQTQKFAEPPALSPSSQGALDALMLQFSRNWRLLSALLALVVIVVAVGWSWRAWQEYKKTDPLKKLGPSLYQPRSDSAADRLAFPTNQPRKTP